MNLFVSIAAGALAAALALHRDLRRRKLYLASSSGWSALALLDLLSAAALAAASVAPLPFALAGSSLRLLSPFTWAACAAVLSLAFVWSEGTRQRQFQRPAGIVFGESLILAGAAALVILARFPPASGRPSIVLAAAGLAIGAGGVVLGAVVPRFLRGGESRRILNRLEGEGESLQPEYVAPTAECPHPEWWRMVDSKSSEVEVLDLLKALVIAAKPRLVVETGTFIGHSALRIAEGMKANGFGRVITIEYDPEIFAAAQKKFAASGLAQWIECRNASSLETPIEGTIDLFFSDSTLALRELEIRHFLPQIDPRGLILVHDASSHFEIVREAALRLEREGLISVVLLSTPRGLVIAQKRAGRR